MIKLIIMLEPRMISLALILRKQGKVSLPTDNQDIC